MDADNGHQHDDSGDGDTAMMITFYIKIFPVIYICLTPASPAFPTLPLRSFLGGPDFGGPVADGNIRVLNSVECGGEIFSLR